MEISSAESDDETEDVILIADKPGRADADEGDCQNSGSHVADSLNCPDEQGRVLVNVGHPTDEPDIYLNSRLATAVKRHQVNYLTLYELIK